MSLRYTGFLATPPCTEGVASVVLARPLTNAGSAGGAFAAIDPRATIGRCSRPGRRVLPLG